MVYESRPGETFLLGASTWRIEEITFQKVIVTPAPGQPGKMPFWHGDGPGRPLELGRAMGAFTRELRGAPGRGEDPAARLRAGGLDERAATNLVAYLDEQAEATGAVPDDRTIVVERFRDEIGDWRVCVLSPFGAQVHAPWAMALQHRLAERWGMAVELMWSDDGIAIRLPESVEELLDEELPHRPGRDHRDPDGPAAVHGDVRQPVPRVRWSCAAAAEAPSRSAHPALAAAAAVGRPAVGGGEVPVLPDPPRGDARVLQRRVRRARADGGAAGPAQPQGAAGVGRHPPGVAVRAVAAVRVDRRLHVRRRCPPRRAPSRRLGPRPRPVAGPARGRGAPRAGRSRCPGRARARAAAARRWAPGPRRRRAPRPPPPPRPPPGRRARRSSSGLGG